MHSLEKKEYIIVIMSRALPSWHGLCHFSFVVLKINVLWPWSFTYASGIYQGRDRATRDGRTFDCRRSWVAFFWTWHWNLSRVQISYCRLFGVCECDRLGLRLIFLWPFRPRINLTDRLTNFWFLKTQTQTTLLRLLVHCGPKKLFCGPKPPEVDRVLIFGQSSVH